MDDQLSSLMESYQPSDKTVALVRSVPLVLIVGISAAGKNTVINKLLESGKFHYIISHVTRNPRTNNGVMEKDGVQYHFMSKNQAIELLQKREFVEAKWVHRQDVYATSAEEFRKCRDEHKTAIADVNVEGVAEYMQIAPDSTTPIFILPPDFQTWQQRFKARYEGQLSDNEFQARLHSVKQEIEHVLGKDYFSIVINDDLEQAVAQVQSIVDGNPQSDLDWQRGSKVAHELLDAIRS